MSEPLATSLGVLAASLLSALVIYLSRRRVTLERERRAGELARLARERWSDRLANGGPALRRALAPDAGASPLSTPELLRRMEDQIVTRVAATSCCLAREEVQQEIDDQLTILQERLHQIESRFPGRTAPDLIASLNEALLSERIDQVAKQVQSIERRVLSKWDVALTVSAMIAGIAFVVGATYAILRIFRAAP